MSGSLSTNSYNIEGFYYAGMSESASKWIGTTIPGISEHTTYDFIDDPSRDGNLTPGSADRIVHEGISYGVRQVWSVSMQMLDRNGDLIEISGNPGANLANFRAYELEGGGGRFILRPLDELFTMPALPHFKHWASFRIADAYPLSSTSIPVQDDPFPVCFVAGTGILTPGGERPVETLAPGDLVMTRDHGPQPMRWIGHMLFDTGRGETGPLFSPIAIAPGALGHGYPATTLRVSPQHRILLRSPEVTRLFGAAEVLCAARALLGRAGIRQERSGPVIHYVHILFDRHEVIVAAGAPSESFFPGPRALASLCPSKLASLAAIFPGATIPAYAPARPFVRGPKIARLLARTGTAPLTERAAPERWAEAG